MIRLFLAGFLVALICSSVSAQQTGEFWFPKVKDAGKVIKLPEAASQPRPDTKICVDLTAGGEADQVNKALEKVARFVNIYAGAGDKAAALEICVILHGDATLICLDDKNYDKQYQTEKNPNLPMIQKLKQAGVEFLVCGQSLAHLGQSLESVHTDIQIAVSALTTNVNRQQDGFVIIPLK